MLRAATASLLLLLVGCASGQDGGGADDDGDTDGDDTDGGDTDEGTFTFTEPAAIGFVVVSSGEVPAYAPGARGVDGGWITSASAGFFLDENESDQCVRKSLGEYCSDTTCSLSPPAAALVSAGTLDLAGLTEPIQLVEGDGVYEGFYQSYFVSNAPSYFVPGQEVSVTASGDVVPAFTLAAPAPDQYLEVVDPPPPTLPYEVVSPDVDRRVAWTPTSRGKVTVRLLVGGPTSLRTIECSRLGTPLVDEIIIPLSEKDAFNAEVTYATEMISYTSDATTTAGEFSVIFEMVSQVVDPSGAVYAARFLQFE